MKKISFSISIFCVSSRITCLSIQHIVGLQTCNDKIDLRYILTARCFVLGISLPRMLLTYLCAYLDVKVLQSITSVNISRSQIVVKHQLIFTMYLTASVNTSERWVVAENDASRPISMYSNYPELLTTLVYKNQPWLTFIYQGC